MGSLQKFVIPSYWEKEFFLRIGSNSVVVVVDGFVTGTGLDGSTTGGMVGSVAFLLWTVTTACRTHSYRKKNDILVWKFSKNFTWLSKFTASNFSSPFNPLLRQIAYNNSWIFHMIINLTGMMIIYHVLQIFTKIGACFWITI